MSILWKIKTATLFQIETKICAEFLTYYSFLKPTEKEKGRRALPEVPPYAGTVVGSGDSAENNRYVPCPYEINTKQTRIDNIQYYKL